ncbi:hypothetical protein N7G274_010121 [Stereocaulon virgatum]|uniref:GPI anchored protein n=1 Tax=Stereocaulon virgatum TaxID=373712 RepID=A0ABR3ZWK6_9LECA
MISITLPLLGLAALGATQSSTASLFLPFLPVPEDPPSLVASIVGSDSTATTYVVDCAPSPTAVASAAVSAAAASILGSGSGACVFGSALTVIEGPSTVLYTVTYATILTETVDCVLSSTTYASCTGLEPVDISFGLGIASGTTSNIVHVDSTTTTIIETGSAAETEFFPVVITAGAANAKPGGGVSATATGGTSTETGAATGKGSTSKTSSAVAVSQTSNAVVGGAPVVGAGMMGAFGVAVAGALL